VAINTGVNVSKLVAYAVLTPPVGVNVSKLNAYAVLALPTGVNVSKVNAYAVLTSGNVTPPIWGSFLFGDGTRGVAYSQSWDMPSSAEIVTYSVLSGALPDGPVTVRGEPQRSKDFRHSHCDQYIQLYLAGHQYVRHGRPGVLHHDQRFEWRNDPLAREDGVLTIWTAFRSLLLSGWHLRRICHRIT
jgi:hypothetical protein